MSDFFEMVQQKYLNFFFSFTERPFNIRKNRTKDKTTSPFSVRYVVQRRVYERNKIAQ